MEHAPILAVAVASAHGNGGDEQVDLIIVGEETRETSRRDRRDREASTGRIALCRVWGSTKQGHV